MNVLGLTCAHDASACIVKDGRLVVAIGAERLTEEKKHHGLCESIVDYVLEASGLTITDIDAVTISDYHRRYAYGVVDASDETGKPIDIWQQNILGNEVRHPQCRIRDRDIPGISISHHLAHCASAFYTSPFEEAYCFSQDASGGLPECNSMVAHGKGTKLEYVSCPRLMVGCAYGRFCERLGIGPQMFKAGAMMGLAAYGQPLDWWEHLVAGVFCENWTQAMEYVDTIWRETTGDRRTFPERGIPSDGPQAKTIAATIQRIFEAAILKAVSAIPHGAYLCLSGGSMLNCNANSLILDKGGFRNIHHFPACTDDGLCVGSALYAAHHLYDEPRQQYTDAEIAYLGQDQTAKLPFDIERVARAIASGKLVAWCNGKSEYGPRALGHRSLLADPRSSTVRDKLNGSIKKREWFRPFAPSVMEDSNEYEFLSPFMLYTQPVARADIPAVTHVDGSCRPQTVSREMNQDYYNLISEFNHLTGVPMVLNTSLNPPGKPIIETAEQAMRFWNEVPVDLMVLNGEIHER